MSQDRVILGRIFAVHGLAGHVMVRTENDDPLNLGRYTSMILIEPGGRERALTLAECGIHKHAARVRFKGINRREAAEELIGGQLFIPRSELLPPPDDAIYVADLMGAMVMTVAGETVGPLTAVYPGGGHDVYGVDKNGREVLIPAVFPIVVDFDRETHTITIDPPEGLLD